MATYTLSTPTAYVDEGSDITIFLNTTGIADNTRIPFVITGTGITSQDFNGSPTLIGNFLIYGNQGSITLNTKSDLLTEYDETLFLTLTSTGNYETIGVTIRDISKTQTNSIVSFRVTATSRSIIEGQYAVFNVTAANLTPGTVVPYKVFGIQQDDLAFGNVVGLLTFLASNVSGTTTANLSLPISQDRLTEGTENAVLILTPEFAYSLEVTGTISIGDTSLTIPAVATLTADKYKVVEGSNVTITLSTVGVANGTVFPWQIVPFKTTKLKSDITIGDFDRISQLSGNFPPISANSSSLVLSVRDDYIFEQSELFYINLPGPEISSAIIEIIDSGNTFLNSDAVYSGNIYVSFIDKASLTANIGGITIGQGYWKDTSGQLSESMFLQGKTPFAPEGAVAYYQPFSYVIRSSKSIEEWGTAIKSMLHPAGLSIFSEINNETLPSTTQKIAAITAGDTDLQTFATITADITKLNASNTQTPNIPALYVDAVSALYNL
jgi:hypothetical protein